MGKSLNFSFQVNYVFLPELLLFDENLLWKIWAQKNLLDLSQKVILLYYFNNNKL